MTEKRIKVKIEHKQKLFYEKFISAWRESSEDRNQKCTLFKAVHNLKHFPLEVNGIVDLKRINGIGEVIAVKCANAWDNICAEYNTDTLSLKEVKALQPDVYKRLLTQKGTKRKQASSPQLAKKTCPINDEFIEVIPQSTRTVSDDVRIPDKENNPDDVQGNINMNNVYENHDKNDVLYLTCEPRQKPEVILICDNREHHGNKKGKTVVEELTKADIRFELRTLSVGDYLWVARLIDGSEVVLDWVVERKTWDDLKSSIRKGRYEEQKQRICQAPIKNRVYLIEGRGKGDVPCEQAIITTITRDGFMIQRCNTGRETASFLTIITKQLMQKATNNTLFGIRFNDLQEVSKKTKIHTVQNVWVRQLTVCPGMSTTKANIMAAAFPSMISLHKHFLKHGDNAVSKLQEILPSIPKSLATQLAKFFAKPNDKE